MKKLLAVLLSLVMAMSLMVPAFAAATPEAGSLGIIGGADGPTAIITTMPEWVNADWENMGSDEWHRLFNERMKQELGGVPGQLGIMINGAYVQFPDAAPENSGGRTMVPVRALVETLGGEVDYQNGTVQFVIDGFEYDFNIGSTTVSVSPAAGNDADALEPEDIVMDCAPYIKDGRTYVPIRFISEALGYEVGWDSAYQTAILLDRNAMAEELDKSFTILNKVQAAAYTAHKEGESLSTEMNGDVTVALMNETYTAEMAGKILLRDEAASGGYSLTLSDKTVEALMVELAAGLTDDEDAELLRAILENLSMEVIMTREGMFWVRTPVLDQLSGEENVWFGMDMGEMLGSQVTQYAFTGSNTSTLGTALAAMVDQNSVLSYSTILSSAQWMIGLYGDENFTVSGDKYTLTIGADDLDPDGTMGLKDMYKECEITMEVDSKGGASVTTRMETDAEAGVPSMTMTMDCTQSGGKAELTMEINVVNICKMTIELTSTQKSTSEKPMSEPPAGATVIDAAELMDS